MTINQLSFPTDPLHDSVTDLISIYGYTEVERMVRMLAPTIAVASAPARRTDPETSHSAAKREKDVGRFSEKSRQSKLLYAFSSSNLTDQQATARVVGSNAAVSAFEGTRRRCSDLRAARYIYDTGKRHKNAGSDDDSIVWGLSEAGREALVRLDLTGWSR